MCEGYEVAQVCLNGHVITSMARSSPHLQKSFCPKCGEKTTMSCSGCDSFIQGDLTLKHGIRIGNCELQSYCHDCGNPFEWTNRAIQAAEELARDDETLEEDELEQFKIDIREITKDSPGSKASANRLKKSLEKMTAATATATRDILVSIASEAVKKMIWPG